MRGPLGRPYTLGAVAPVGEGGPETGSAMAEVAGGRVRRHLLFGPNSRFSHRRNVSRETSTPMRIRPALSASTDSPARLSRRSSSRCGVRVAVTWLRGCRTSATARARVVGEVAGDWLYVGCGVVVMLLQYMQRNCSAMAAPRCRFKPKGLDVGVSLFCFVLFFQFFERSISVHWYIFESVERCYRVLVLGELTSLFVVWSVKEFSSFLDQLVISQWSRFAC